MQSRIDAKPSILGSVGDDGPVGWPRTNLENQNDTSGFDFVKQFRELATVSQTHGSMSVGGILGPGPAPFNFEIAYCSPTPPSLPN